MLSADYRRAVAAEAAGNLESAAEHYGLVDDRASAVRVHLLRAARAGGRAQELAALRDALHWAGADPTLRQRPAAELGKSLLAGLEAEGIATERDRERLREAAELLVAGGEYQRAGDALAKIGDHLGAADAYSAGGLVEAMEEALAKDDDGQRRVREEHEAYASYQTALAVGRRDAARAELARCVALASGNPEYRRLLDGLESKLVTAGRIELVVRGRPPLVVCAVRRIVLGRDALCDLVLRSGGVSRQHAEIEVEAPARFVLRDVGSRNGTSVGGLPIAGAVELGAAGAFALGDECTIEHERVPSAAGPTAAVRALPTGPLAASTSPSAGPVERPVLRLRVSAGLDRGTSLWATTDEVAIELTPAELGVAICFREGRPFLWATTAREVRFQGEPLGPVAVQLIRGDRLRVDGVDVDVA